MRAKRALRLTDATLIRTLKGFPDLVWESDSRATFTLALAIVKHYLGRPWIDQHLDPTVLHPGFMTINTSALSESERSTFRVVSLAEQMINLQHVAGFDDCIDRLKSGIIEPTCAELDFGTMLHGNLLKFRFVKPQQRLGLDYDIEIYLDDNLAICADAKCKIESTEFSEETVKNTLKSARKQFPADRPSAIFVKVPPQWLTQAPHSGQRLIEIAKAFLRSTGRIVSVKFYMGGFSYAAGVVTHHQLFTEVTNPHNRFDPNRNWTMFGKGTAEGGKLQNWKRLVEFAPRVRGLI